jgi:hypothetical protein
MRLLRGTLLAGMVVLACGLSRASAEEAADEMVDNPLYKGWVGFHPGARATVKEKTVMADGSTEEKEIAYRLEKVSDKGAVVHTSVVTRELLSRIETAPTKIVYPAKVNKADLEAAVLNLNAKRGTETLKVLGKDLECMTFEVTRKKGNEEVKSKIWRSATVPGGIVKRVRTTSEDGKLVATTTTTLASYRVAPKEKPGAKPSEKK